MDRFLFFFNIIRRRGKPLFLCEERFLRLEQEWRAQILDRSSRRWGVHQNRLWSKQAGKVAYNVFLLLFLNLFFRYFFWKTSNLRLGGETLFFTRKLFFKKWFKWLFSIYFNNSLFRYFSTFHLHLNTTFI